MTRTEAQELLQGLTPLIDQMVSTAQWIENFTAARHEWMPHPVQQAEAHRADLALLLAGLEIFTAEALIPEAVSAIQLAADTVQRAAAGMEEERNLFRLEAETAELETQAVRIRAEMEGRRNG